MEETNAIKTKLIRHLEYGAYYVTIEHYVNEI